MTLSLKLKGRSLAASLPGHKIAVIKLANPSRSGPKLRRELQWMVKLSDLPLPEIIEAAAAVAAVCVAGRFLKEAETGIQSISER